MKQDIRLIVLEHLGHQLDIHVLYIDFLRVFSEVHKCRWHIKLTCRLLFNTEMASFSFSFIGVSILL